MQFPLQIVLIIGQWAWSQFEGQVCQDVCVENCVNAVFSDGGGWPAVAPPAGEGLRLSVRRRGDGSEAAD